MGTYFRQEWYGTQAKIIEQREDYIVVDYGCQGRGIITNYFLFDGIQLCFLEFDTAQTMPSQKFNPDIIQITHCQKGRYDILYRACCIFDHLAEPETSDTAI